MGKKDKLLPSMVKSFSEAKDTVAKSGDTGNYVGFLGKKIMVRIIYPGSYVETYKVKVSMHYFKIEDGVYFFHSDAFYREGKWTKCDYYYGNPQPILYKHTGRGLIIASKKLKADLEAGKYTDEEGDAITYSTWLTLDHKQKLLFPDVVEFDATMINRIINYNFTDKLFTPINKGLFGDGKSKIIVWIIIIALAVGFAVLRMKGAF